MNPASYLSNVLKNFSRNLNVAMQVLLGRRFYAHQFHASLGQLLLLCLAIWSLSAFDDLIDADFSFKVSQWGLVTDAAQNYFWLAAIALVVVITRQNALFLIIAVPIAATSIIVWVVWILLTQTWWHLNQETYLTYFRPLWWVSFTWEVIAVWRILYASCYVNKLQTTALTLVYTAAIYAAISILPTRPMFIKPPSDYASTSLDVESIYYAQRNLLANQVTAIVANNPSKSEIYAIGFAAYGSEDVFMHETLQALDVIKDTFQAHGKTISLVNNPQTVEAAPIASTHNLRNAIRTISEKMDLENDLLVVFLTSHGDENSEIAVELDNLGLNDLSAKELRLMLDDHAIKWRVVIVSACYSGSFIPELQSSTTMIITAADADKTSFGCDHKRKWTYFGEAYFRDALPTAKRFGKAFDFAKREIQQRELDEGKEPSLPQIVVGNEIQTYLDAHQF